MQGYPAKRGRSTKCDELSRLWDELTCVTQRRENIVGPGESVTQTDVFVTFVGLGVPGSVLLQKVLTMSLEEKTRRVEKIEFWVSTAIYLMLMFAVWMESAELPMEEYPGAPVIIPFLTPILREWLQVTVIYVAFVVMTLFVVPRLRKRESLIRNLIWVAVLLLVMVVVFGSIDVIIGPPAAFLVYTLLKHRMLYLWDRSPEIYARYKFLAPGVLLVVNVWLLSLALFFIGEADQMAIAAWLTMIPTGILVYSYSFLSFIPSVLKKKRRKLRYLWKVTLLLLLVSLPVGLLSTWITQDGDVGIAIVFFNIFFQFLITAPFSWIFFKRRQKDQEEVVSLQKELGQSEANVDFLRSQINPHFLFNVMNTLYGTAIHEKAERTAEGIQKLADMMRFMLHENMQPKILLARELEYLSNYINLQRLRTDAIPDVTIDTHIDDRVTFDQIAPMLLIPFVENAFKHGISFRDPSYIRINLTIGEKRIDFDVSNSRHAKSVDDPERNKSGIGLDNVRQRLQLFYPERHELIIRETEREYFIHLSIQLS